MAFICVLICLSFIIFSYHGSTLIYHKNSITSCLIMCASHQYLSATWMIITKTWHVYYFAFIICSQQVPIPLGDGDGRRGSDRARGVRQPRRDVVPNVGRQAGEDVRRVQHQVQEGLYWVERYLKTWSECLYIGLQPSGIRWRKLGSFMLSIETTIIWRFVKSHTNSKYWAC